MYLYTNKQANKPTNKTKPNKAKQDKTNKQNKPNKQTNKQTNKPTNKRTNKKINNMWRKKHVHIRVYIYAHILWELAKSWVNMITKKGTGHGSLAASADFKQPTVPRFFNKLDADCGHLA
jgi:hypothetical protein